MTPIILSFDYASYIANPQFGMYSNPTTYPEALLQSYWDVAINYASPINVGYIHDDKRQYAIQLMLSHIIYLTNLANTGNGTTSTGGSPGTVPYLMSSATIDKVTVSVVAPPIPNQFQWWLGLSPFGQMLLALLQVNSVGGGYYGGSAPRLGMGVGALGPWGWGCGSWPV